MQPQSTFSLRMYISHLTLEPRGREFAPRWTHDAEGRNGV
jgi:hypothetical protein